MAHVSVAIIMNAPSKAELTEETKQLLALRMIGDIRPFVPIDSGMLADSGRYEDGAIVYGDEFVPYARRLYHGVNYKFKTKVHKQAGAMWFTRAKEMHQEKWLKVAKATFLEVLRR